MTILEPIINEVSERFGLRESWPANDRATLAYKQRTHRGLQGFLDQFRRAGLGDLVSSWVSQGANTSLTTEQLERAAGAIRSAVSPRTSTYRAPPLAPRWPL